jgi:hypothetical protein
VTTTAPVFKANAEGRTAWLASIYGPQQDWHRANRTPAPLELVTEALDRIAEEGAKLGRTEAWKNAVAWHAATLAENPTDESHIRWTCTQGSVWLGYAA